MSNSIELETKARFRVLIAKSKNVTAIEITTDKIPGRYREALRTEIEIWQCESPYPTIPYWWWRPDYDEKIGLCMPIADKLASTQKSLAAQLAAEFGCGYKKAADLMRQLLEMELGGPLLPEEGVRNYLEVWVAS